MDSMVKDCLHHEPPYGSCATIPELERLSYFFGQMLEPADFLAEQQYHSTLLSLLGRHTAGWGVACGLDVHVLPGGPADGKDLPALDRLVLELTPGIALDCCGRLIVLRKPYRCRLAGLLDSHGRTALQESRPLYVSIVHVERPVRPSRGLGEGCDPLAIPQYGRIRDEARVDVSAHAPEYRDCEGCLDGCGDRRVLLASVQVNDPQGSPQAEIRPELRRLLARHDLAAITHVGWIHGATYTRRQAEQLLTDGLGLRFSRPIHARTLQEGVIDLMIYEGGTGRRDAVYYKAVNLVTEPDKQLVTQVTIKVAEPESFNVGDRLHLSVRCDFILDACCRAVSGAHLGGGVPFDQGLSQLKPHPQGPGPLVCERPPDREGPWRSGNGVEGGVWESWIKVGPDGGGYGGASEGRRP